MAGAKRTRAVGRSKNVERLMSRARDTLHIGEEWEKWKKQPYSPFGIPSGVTEGKRLEKEAREKKWTVPELEGRIKKLGLLRSKLELQQGVATKRAEYFGKLQRPKTRGRHETLARELGVLRNGVHEHLLELRGKLNKMDPYNQWAKYEGD
jgi:hypothetical protein